MHRCLTLPEVLRNIVERTAEDAGGIATVSALSRTCRLLHDAAEDALWRDQEGLTTLLKCMPEDVWDLHEMNGEEDIIVGTIPFRLNLCFWFTQF